MAKVRLADIAKVAGVSAVTVHNAITGQKGVSDEMRARILEIAKEWDTASREAEREIHREKACAASEW